MGISRDKEANTLPAGKVEERAWTQVMVGSPAPHFPVPFHTPRRCKSTSPSRPTATPAPTMTRGRSTPPSRWGSRRGGGGRQGVWGCREVRLPRSSPVFTPPHFHPPLNTQVKTLSANEAAMKAAEKKAQQQLLQV